MKKNSCFKLQSIRPRILKYVIDLTKKKKRENGNKGFMFLNSCGKRAAEISKFFLINAQNIVLMKGKDEGEEKGSKKGKGGV